MDHSDRLRAALAEELGCSIGEALARGLTPEQAFAEAKAWEQERLEHGGWFVHYVGNDTDTGLANIHTHGLEETAGHPDFQLVAPVPPALAQGILQRLVDRVKGGERFEAGRRYDGVVEAFDVLMVGAEESGRPVLRVVLPDRHGCLDRGAIEEPWGDQWP